MRRAVLPARIGSGRDEQRGVGCPQIGYSPPEKRSKLVAGGEWDA